MGRCNKFLGQRKKKRVKERDPPRRFEAVELSDGERGGDRIQVERER